jgi:hypothetical protein
MKKLIYLIVLIVILGLVLTGCLLSNVGQVPATEQSGITYLTKGLSPVLVARWNFDEGSGQTAGDATGVNDGQLGSTTGVDANDPSWSADQWWGGYALSFDGINDYVEVADSSSLDITGVITIEAWIYPTAVSDYRCIVAKRLGNFANYVLRLNGGKVEFYYSGPSASGTVTDWNVWATSSTVVSTGSWYHVAVAFTFAGGPIAVYVDGASQSGSWIAGDSSDPATPNDYLLRIGMAHPGYPQYFKGLIDEVRIWSNVLDDTQLDDMLPPAITITTPSATTYLLNEVVNADWSVSDGTGTGVAYESGTVLSGSPINTSTVGSYDFTITATDYAKNTDSKKVTYNVIYNWAGFFPPVDDSVLNAAKAGSAIPVKFSLDGNQGLDIFATTYPKSIPIQCDGTDPVGIIEVTMTAGGSSLSYDTATGQYIYVWKTDKKWAGSCRRLEVKLKDGTSHFADFKFK